MQQSLSKILLLVRDITDSKEVRQDAAIYCSEPMVLDCGATGSGEIQLLSDLRTSPLREALMRTTQCW